MTTSVANLFLLLLSGALPIILVSVIKDLLATVLLLFNLLLAL